MRVRGALLGVLIFGGLAFESKPASAQDHAFLQGADGPTIDEYVKQWRNAKVVPPGSLKIDGSTVKCGKRPTVLNSYFDSWGGAFPGFLILNTKKINGLSTAVKLYVYSMNAATNSKAGRDQSRPLRHRARREVKLAGRHRHGGNLHLHLDGQGRFGASARTRALRDYAQALCKADQGRHPPVGKREPANSHEAKGKYARAAIAFVP